MSEGVVTIEDHIAIICESGAEKYQKGGKGPLDFIILH